MNTFRTIMSPISVNYEVTPSCDLECTFCFVEALCRRPHPPLDRVIRIIDLIWDAEVFELRLFGGEFFVYPHWREVLEYAHSKGFYLSFVSNGTHITDEVIQVLLDCEVEGGGISLHGPKDVHEAITKVEGSFDLAVDAIRRCLDAGLGITVLTTLTRENKDRIYEIATMLNAKGLIRENSAYGVSRLCPYGRAASEWEKIRLSLKDYQRVLKALERIESEFGIIAILADAFPICLINPKHRELIQGCQQSTGFGHISHDGTVRPCGVALSSFGNILETPLKDIWQSTRLLEYRDLKWMPQRCQECDIFCGGGCVASAISDCGYAPDEFILEVVNAHQQVVSRQA